MSIKIFAAVILGGLSGYFLPLEQFGSNLAVISDLGLMILLFFVGMDIGEQKDIFDTIKKMGLKILLVPISIIIGSIVGGMLSGLILDIPLNEAGALGSGLGWYTLSATILTREGLVKLSALAFLSNVFREVIALVLMPKIADNIGYLEAVAAAGATAMDTALPMISKTTNAQTSIIAFVSGVICTSSVPIILPIILKIGA